MDGQIKTQMANMTKNVLCLKTVSSNKYKLTMDLAC